MGCLSNRHSADGYAPAPEQQTTTAPRNNPHANRKPALGLGRRRRSPISHRLAPVLFILFSYLHHGEPRKERECLPEIEQCPDPLLINSFSPSSTQPQDTPQLGDGIRSEEASGVFFDSLDADGDGAIEPEEMATFLRDEIGGKHFDTQIEVDEEVGAVMKRLDDNKNNELEMSDMLNYWITLESLLSAEEVSEWIVYSVQLPSSVGRIFLENGITGYDFLEIVDNGGLALEHDLGITKISLRNKIVRAMQTRMLGIGSYPDTPGKVKYKLESCKAVSLSWEHSTARVFPVHSYRVQRRAINLFGNARGIDSPNGIEVSTPNSSEFFDSRAKSDSSWRTVYVGGENEYVDSGLDTGHSYTYRIQAWNSAGRSGWATVDLTRDLKKQRCSTKPSERNLVTERGIPLSDDVTEEWEWMSTPKRVLWGIVTSVQVIYHSVRFVLAMFAMLAGIMRFRRATATSSSAARAVLPFPSFWNGLNRLTRKYIGQEFIPKTMLGDKNAIKLQERMHDERMNAKGLRGYDKMIEKADHVSPDKSLPNNTVNRRLAMNRRKSASTGNLMAGRQAAVQFSLPTEVSIVRKEAVSPSPGKFSWVRNLPGRNSSIATSSDASVDPSEITTRSTAARSTVRGSVGRTRHSSMDDNDRCSECHKPFKIGKRYKHHCSRCMAIFCHKHGRTTHSNFTSCKMPGDCLCNTCLSIRSERSERLDRSEGSQAGHPSRTSERPTERSKFRDPVSRQTFSFGR